MKGRTAGMQSWKGGGEMFLIGHRENPYAQLISNNVFAQQEDIPSEGPV